MFFFRIKMHVRIDCTSALIIIIKTTLIIMILLSDQLVSKFNTTYSFCYYNKNNFLLYVVKS